MPEATTPGRAASASGAVRAEDLATSIAQALAMRGNPVRAAAQQAYMRSDLPYFGLGLPEVRKVVGALLRAHPLPERGRWEQVIRLLWDRATHREQWYAALVVARFPRHRPWATDLAALPLWEHLIRTGAWWDVCDEIAEHLLGPMLAAHPQAMTGILRGWAVDPHRWIRRVSILAQNRRRADTDTDLLAHCLAGSLDDSDFFARKAIGWALREYSKTNPDWVLGYVAANDGRLSGLSRREAVRLIR